MLNSHSMDTNRGLHINELWQWFIIGIFNRIHHYIDNNVVRSQVANWGFLAPHWWESLGKPWLELAALLQEPPQLAGPGPAAQTSRWGVLETGRQPSPVKVFVLLLPHGVLPSDASHVGPPDGLQRYRGSSCRTPTRLVEFWAAPHS